MMEMIIVLVVIALLAAVAIPSFIGFIRHGQQVNRANIARTLYIAMQNQLSRANVEGNLREVLTNHFYDSDGNIITPTGSFNVESSLLGTFPSEDTDNADYVFSVSLRANYPFGNTDSLQDQFYTLLDEVIINKDILRGAILMEFNVRTGVVMSIFYGDHLSGQEQFGYDRGGNENIQGPRGMGSGYPSTAYRLQQGYFGVNNTGFVPELPIDDIVRIFDGMVYQNPFTNEFGLDIGSGEKRYNVLYAEFLIAKDTDGNPRSFSGVGYNFYIFNDTSPNTVLLDVSNVSNIADSFDTAFNNTDAIFQADEAPIVDLDGANIGASYTRYVWVIDYIEGDMIANGTPNSMWVKYATDLSSIKDTPANLRARLVAPTGTVTNSLMRANSHFRTQITDNTFEVASVRHLNNINEVPDGIFMQTEHIDVSTLLGTITPSYNFRPIASLGKDGRYFAERPIEETGGAQSQYRIENLIINTAAHTAYNNGNVGLFSHVNGQIIGISVFNATINAPNAKNVGAIAGELGEENPDTPNIASITRSNTYSTINGGTVSNAYTGGLVGHMRQYTRLMFSFNAGYYDAHNTSETQSGIGQGDPQATGAVTGAGENGAVGGLVGLNRGTISNSFNNARVNILDVVVTEDDAKLSTEPTASDIVVPNRLNLGGIAGINGSVDSIIDCYATNFVGIYDATGVSSAGIANGTGTITRSVFITNGATDGSASNETIDKSDLMDWHQAASNAFIASPFRGIYEAAEGRNLYSAYPYPILESNNPFVDILASFTDNYGWEDIEGIVDTPEGGFVYYEYYEDSRNPRGFLNSFEPDLPLSPNPQNPRQSLSPDHHNKVIHDGYALEFREISNDVYRLELNRVKYIIMPDSEGLWRIYSYDGSNATLPLEEQVELLPNWLPAQRFEVAQTGTDEPIVYQRLYFPNDWIEALFRVNRRIDVELFVGTDDDAPPMEGIIETFNPLYAAFTTANGRSDEGIIRSPRHIRNIADTLNGIFLQTLNIDFEIYRRELLRTPTQIAQPTYIVDPITVIFTSPDRLSFTAAVVPGTFTGIYNGNAYYIENVHITGNSNDVGLFSISTGIIENVTMRFNWRTTNTPSISGGNRVGTLVGESHGTIRGCSIQQTADYSQAATVLWAHPITVLGVTDTGGVVGRSTGRVEDVIFISTSARPAVGNSSGTLPGAPTHGGIVGNNVVGLINEVVYLAVAPMSGTNMFPFAGTNIGIINENRHYLSGTRALRPNQTRIPAVINYNHPGNLRPDAMARTTSEIVAAPLFSALNWRIDAPLPAGTAPANQNNTVFPYPYPINTVPPEPAQPLSNRQWPIADTVVLDLATGMVYYERYADGTTGVFTRRLDPATGVIVEIDHLNYSGLAIVEAGYAVNQFGLNTNSMRTYWFSQDNGFTWRTDRYSLSDGGTTFTYATQVYWPFDASILHTEGGRMLDPTKPVIIFIARQNGSALGTPPPSDPAAALYINPFFAKEIYHLDWYFGTSPDGSYPVSGVSNTANHVRITSPQAEPHEHFIRTPWQMQQISRAANTVIDGVNTTFGQTFIQELNLNFNQVTPNFVASYNGQSDTTGSRGVRPVFDPVTTADNIIRGTFEGTYKGNANAVMNLTLSGTTTTAINKALFNTIGTNGVIQDLAIIESTFSGLTTGGNASFASTNNGLIENVAFISSSASSPVSGGATAGGIVNNNTGTINQALYLARAPVNGGVFAPVAVQNSGNITETYFLSGNTSANNRPTATTLAVGAAGNYNFPTTSAVLGQPRTTQEINALRTNPLWNTGLWHSLVQPTVNTLTVNTYPYPLVTTTVPGLWPVATLTTGISVAYYEEYQDGTVGFFPAPTGFPTLNNNNSVTISETGYAVLVPRAGGYSVKIGTNGENSHIATNSRSGIGAGSVSYVKIPTTLVPANAISSDFIFVNDHTTNSIIDTRFAKGVYTGTVAADVINAAQTATTRFIRRPYQMRNINMLSTTSGVTFLQERDLDFTNFQTTAINNDGAVVRGAFAGNYEGGGNMISGLTINYVQQGTADLTSYVGLFIQNTGNIRGITLSFNNTATVTATDIPIRAAFNSGSSSSSVIFVGTIAGQNTGTIEDVTVVSTLTNAAGTAALVPVGLGASQSQSANIRFGGVVGENLGVGGGTPIPATMRRVVYLAPAPVNTATTPNTITPIVNTDSETAQGATSVSYTDIYYLGCLDADTAKQVIVSTINPANVTGFNYEGMTVVGGTAFTRGTTDAISNTIRTASPNFWTTASPSVWTPSPTPAAAPIWTLPTSTTPTPPLDAIDFETYQTIYPFINRALTSPAGTAPPSIPIAWPVVSTNIPAFTPAMMALSFDLDLDEDELDELDDLNKGDDDDVDGEELVDDDDDEEPVDDDDYETDLEEEEDEPEEDTDEIELDGDSAHIVGAISLFGGGYKITQSKTFRNLLRRSNARSIRKINEYNDRKRRSREEA